MEISLNVSLQQITCYEEIGWQTFFCAVQVISC